MPTGKKGLAVDPEDVPVEARLHRDRHVEAEAPAQPVAGVARPVGEGYLHLVDAVGQGLLRGVAEAVAGDLGAAGDVLAVQQDPDRGGIDARAVLAEPGRKDGRPVHHRVRRRPGEHQGRGRRVLFRHRRDLRFQAVQHRDPQVLVGLVLGGDLRLGQGAVVHPEVVNLAGEVSDQAGAVEAGPDVEGRLEGAGLEGIAGVLARRLAVHVDPDLSAVEGAGHVGPGLLADAGAGGVHVLGTVGHAEDHAPPAEAEAVVLPQDAAAVLRQQHLIGDEGRVHPAAHRGRAGEPQPLGVGDLHVVVLPVETQGVSLRQRHVLRPVDDTVESVFAGVAGDGAIALVEGIVGHEAVLLRRSAGGEEETEEGQRRSESHGGLASTKE